MTNTCCCCWRQQIHSMSLALSLCGITISQNLPLIGKWKLSIISRSPSKTPRGIGLPLVAVNSQNNMLPFRKNSNTIVTFWSTVSGSNLLNIQWNKIYICVYVAFLTNFALQFAVAEPLRQAVRPLRFLYCINNYLKAIVAKLYFASTALPASAAIAVCVLTKQLLGSNCGQGVLPASAAIEVCVLTKLLVVSACLC